MWVRRCRYGGAGEAAQVRRHAHASQSWAPLRSGCNGAHSTSYLGLRPGSALEAFLASWRLQAVPVSRCGEYSVPESNATTWARRAASSGWAAGCNVASTSGVNRLSTICAKLAILGRPSALRCHVGCQEHLVQGRSWGGTLPGVWRGATRVATESRPMQYRRAVM